MKRLALAVAILLVLGGASPARGDGIPNLFQLVGVPPFPEPIASGGPAPINPGVLVGLNPQPLPPFPNPANVSLTNPGDPVISIADQGAAYSVVFGMDLPPSGPGNPGGPVSFVPPGPPPVGGAGMFTGSIGNSLFDVFFQVSSDLGPLNTNTWSASSTTLDGLPAVQLNFAFSSLGTSVVGPDPTTFSFQVFSAGSSPAYNFAETPEPGSLLLLGTGLAGFASRLRKRRAK